MTFRQNLIELQNKRRKPYRITNIKLLCNQWRTNGGGLEVVIPPKNVRQILKILKTTSLYVNNKTFCLHLSESKITNKQIEFVLSKRITRRSTKTRIYFNIRTLLKIKNKNKYSTRWTGDRKRSSFTWARVIDLYNSCSGSAINGEISTHAYSFRNKRKKLNTKKYNTTVQDYV